MLNKIFLELIRVAIGSAGCLSHTPTAKEWQMLYEMAKKQSLVGVCFAGVQKLQKQHQSPPEMLYLQWMGMAAKIQQKNEVVSKQCIEIQKRFDEEGVGCCILKGQGSSGFYPEHLRNLRQSGDIDVWVDIDVPTLKQMLTRRGVRQGKYSYIHMDCDFFKDPSTSSGGPTEVELHYRASSLRDLMANSYFQKWSASYISQHRSCENGFNIPADDFNRIYSILHCYRHVIGAGIGIRQLMDVYFILKNTHASEDEYQVLHKLGLTKFTGALKWVLGVIFENNGRSETVSIALCSRIESNAVEGQFLLDQILDGGNFGRYSDKKKSNRLVDSIYKNLRYLKHYPMELLWSPFWKLYELYWINKYK